MGSQQAGEAWQLLENGGPHKGLSKEMRRGSHGRTAHNMSSTSLRKKSDLTLIHKLRCGVLRDVLANFQEVILGTKLSVLFPAIPLAILADFYGYGRVSIRHSFISFHCNCNGPSFLGSRSISLWFFFKKKSFFIEKIYHGLIRYNRYGHMEVFSFYFIFYK